jgi:hypothetical protein
VSKFNNDFFIPVDAELIDALREDDSNARLTINEFIVLVEIDRHCDYGTGIFTGCAEKIEKLTKEQIKEDVALLVFKSLEKKKRLKIFRKAKGMRGNYPILRHGFRIRSGPKEGMILDALNTSDPKSPIYRKGEISSEDHPKNTRTTSEDHPKNTRTTPYPIRTIPDVPDVPDVPESSESAEEKPTGSKAAGQVVMEVRKAGGNLSTKNVAAITSLTAEHDWIETEIRKATQNILGTLDDWQLKQAGSFLATGLEAEIILIRRRETENAKNQELMDIATEESRRDVERQLQELQNEGVEMHL